MEEYANMLFEEYANMFTWKINH